MSNITWNFKDSVVVITGASTGIGRGTALAFAQAGASMAVCDFNETAGAETAQLCREAGAPDARFFKVNVQSEEEVEQAKEQILADFGTVDILFSNAGIFPKDMAHPLEELSDELWQRVFDINFFGAIRVCRAFAPVFKAKKSGKIIVTSSVSMNRPNANAMPYCASKVALASLAQSLCLELGPYNVNVNVVCPAYVFTQIYANGGGLKIKADRGGFENCRSDEAVMNQMAKSSALGRAQTPQDIANAVMYLSSDAASEITGQVINVDSGLVFRY